jgi:hypothetical protein
VWARDGREAAEIRTREGAAPDETGSPLGLIDPDQEDSRTMSPETFMILYEPVET